MLYSTVILAAAFTGLASAQVNYTTSGPLNVTASQIPAVQRQAWCRGQTNNCPLVCGGSASPNTCDPDNLSYTCTCTDGSMPNITDYAQMLPSFLCDQWISNCVLNHPNDLTGITACRSVQCGMKNATLVESGGSNSSSSGSGSSSASAAASMTASASMTTSAASSAAAATTATSSTSSRTGGAVTAHAESFGTVALTFVLMGMFGWAM